MYLLLNVLTLCILPTQYICVFRIVACRPVARQRHEIIKHKTEPRGRGTSAVKSCYRATATEVVTVDTSVCVRV
jgi:hypothetical protein